MIEHLRHVVLVVGWWWPQAAARRRARSCRRSFPACARVAARAVSRAFSGLKDIEEQSAFNRFIVGEKQDVRVDKPYGVALYQGKMYVCDTNASVVVFDLERKSFGLLKGAVGHGKLTQPVNIRIEADGTKYVADPVRGQVVAFDRNDEYLKAYGAPGAWRPVDAVPLADRVYVADVANGLIKVFDKDSGALLKAFGDKGDPSERLDRPTNLAFDTEGNLYVTDVGRFQVVKYDRDGHFKTTIGSGDNMATSRGRRVLPSTVRGACTPSTPPSITCRSSARRDACWILRSGRR